MRPTTPLLALLAAAGLAACGSSSPSSKDPSKQDAMVNFAKCMRANGVPSFPDSPTNGTGGLVIERTIGSGASMKVNGVSVSAPAFQSAMQHCQSKLPNGGHPPTLSAARRAAMLRFAQCMRTHGVTNFPDPSFSSDGPRLLFGSRAGLNPNSPAFQQAQTACAHLVSGALKFQAKGP